MQRDHEIEHTFLQQILAITPSDDLVQASEGGYTHLMELADAALTGEPPTKAHIAQELQNLADLAHQKMGLASPTVLWIWRILYTDSCIFHALAISEFATTDQSVGLLDKAIIIAGGGDDDRLCLILSLVSKFQQKNASPSILSEKLLNTKRITFLNPLFTAQCDVPAIDTNLSFLSFQKIHSRRPFIIRGYAKEWPALNEHSWNSIDYLLSVSGPSRIVPVEVGHDYRSNDWSQDLMSWESFLGAVEATAHPSSREGRKELYLAQYNLFRQFPSLQRDIFIPDYIYCTLDHEYPDYKPPNNDEGVILNTWLGPEGAMSPAHFDPYYNFYVQIVGYKRVWLCGEEATQYMEAHRCAERLGGSYGASSTSASNTSHVDVFSEEDAMRDFPAFSKNVVPQAMQVILGPGDLLFFPPGWWHGMRNETASFSISMWF